jgi:hypothetical protein
VCPALSAFLPKALNVFDCNGQVFWLATPFNGLPTYAVTGVLNSFPKSLQAFGVAYSYGDSAGLAPASLFILHSA